MLHCNIRMLVFPSRVDNTLQQAMVYSHTDSVPAGVCAVLQVLRHLHPRWSRLPQKPDLQELISPAVICRQHF